MSTNQGVYYIMNGSIFHGWVTGMKGKGEFQTVEIDNKRAYYVVNVFATIEGALNFLNSKDV